MTLQERIFDAWVGFMLRHRVLVLLLVATITGVLAWRVSQLPVMNALRDMLPEDTAMEAYEAARARFGGDETVLVAIEAGDHFTEAGVERLRKLTDALADHPLAERVVSLTTADWIHPSEGGGLRVEPFGDLEPEALRTAALADPLVRGTLVSPDGAIVLVAVQLVPNEDHVYSREEVRRYVNHHVERIPGGAAQLQHANGPRRAIEGAKHYVEPEFMRVAKEAGYSAGQVHLSGFPVIFGSLLIASQDNIKILFPFTVMAAFQIEVENSLTRKLPEDHPVRAGVRVIERAVGGSWQMEVVIDSGREEGLKAEGFLEALGRLEHAIEALPKVGVVQSVADVMAQMHGVLAPDHPAALPNTPAMVAQYLLLFEMSGGEDLSVFVDPTLRHLRLAVRLADMTAEEGIALGEEMERLIDEMLPAGASGYSGGFGLMTARAGPEILRGSLRGLATALVLIAILMGVLFRSVRVALLSIVPNLLPVAFGLVMASWFVSQVDVDALMNLTICIGIAVDDTIHFLSRYRIERRRGLDRPDAVRATIVEAGHGITRTSLILIGGFAVLLFSDVMGLRVAGVMLPATLASAVLFDLTLVPAMAQLGLLEPHE